MDNSFDKFRRFLSAAVRNMSQSFYDDFCKTNCNFRSKAGISPKVIRRTDGKCCEWCSDLAGTYDYGAHPSDIFRRHKNCQCTVVVKYDKKRYQDVYSKKEYKNERDARIAQTKKQNSANTLNGLTGKRLETEINLQSKYEKDIIIHRSVGAKAINYDVELPNGEFTQFSPNTRITKITTIAGKGKERKIDEVAVLIERYGGKEENWQKKKGIGYLNYNGEIVRAEVHWYEEETAGKHEFKAKSKNGEWILGYKDD